ncbi:MAG: hypothetical protein HFI71_03400 [Lachnospiraceae bacterium]|nr:hypothetical protein [Lachnospiraceae bacterium]
MKQICNYPIRYVTDEPAFWSVAIGMITLMEIVTYTHKQKITGGSYE